MNSECLVLCPSRTGKLLWLIGLLFTSILVVQYLELPRGNIMSCIFSANKASSHFIRRSYFHDLGNSTISSKTRKDSIISSVSHGASIDFPKVVHDRDPVDDSLFEGPNEKSTMNANKTNFSLQEEKAGGGRHVSKPVRLTTPPNSSSVRTQRERISSISEGKGRINTNRTFSYFLAPPVVSPFQAVPPRNRLRNKKPPAISSVPGRTELNKEEVIHQRNKTIGIFQSSSGLWGKNCSMVKIAAAKEISNRVVAGVESIATMNKMLLHSQTSPPSESMELCSSATDRELLEARSQIEKAANIRNYTGLYAPIYWNISRFKRSYELMEQTLKVYIYREGNRPVFHQPRLKGIYASEGWFMKLLEASKQFVTTNPREAHLFYLPFSSQMLEEALYVPNSHSFDNLKNYLKNYIDFIKARYPFWNRTSGTDHFLVGCHDWAPEETRRLMANCIRALCNADLKEGFQIGKDVSLPETYMHSSLVYPKELGGNPPSQRQILAFFAGKMHGYVRPILLEHWENRDPDMKIVGRMQKGSYIQHMKSSKYCICARGYEVNSPRVVEAIMYGCVPVIISDNFVPPFLEVLNWEKFAVFVLEKDVPNLKKILLSISNRRYLTLQWRVKLVRQHFLWHPVPVKFDIFHMILHSVWYNRVFLLTQQ